MSTFKTEYTPQRLYFGRKPGDVEAEQEEWEAKAMSDPWRQVDIGGIHFQARIRFMSGEGRKAYYVIELDRTGSTHIWLNAKGEQIHFDTREEAREELKRHIKENSFMSELGKL